MQYGKYGFWFLSMKKPCRQVRTITSEIHYRSSSVLYRVGEPFEEFGITSDFYRSFMAIIYVHTQYRTDISFFNDISRMPVAAVPCCLIIGENLYTIFL